MVLELISKPRVGTMSTLYSYNAFHNNGPGIDLRTKSWYYVNPLFL
jgi:hypothetical protein